MTGSFWLDFCTDHELDLLLDLLLLLLLELHGLGSDFLKSSGSGLKFLRSVEWDFPIKVSFDHSNVSSYG